MAGVTGTLGLFSLVDLFQLLASATRTGRLRIQHPLGSARVYFDRGQIVHAEFGELEGQDAVLALFADERGTFAFTSGLPAPRRSVDGTTQSLVLDALRRLDEQRRDGTPEVSREAVPYAPDDAPRTLPLGEDERRVVAAVNGQWTVARVSHELELPLHEVQRIVGRLVSVGGLSLRTKRPRTAQLVVVPERDRVGGWEVGVDAGILRNWEQVTGEAVAKVAIRREDGTAFAMPVVPVSGGGPYLYVGHDTLVRSELRVDESVLVRPHAE
jgi:hypothetical protein